MRSSIPLPDKASGEVHQSFRSIQAQVDHDKVPLIEEKANLQHLREGQSARHFEDDKLYLYTRHRGKLYCLIYQKVAPIEPMDAVTVEGGRVYSSIIQEPSRSGS